MKRTLLPALLGAIVTGCGSGETPRSHPEATERPGRPATPQPSPVAARFETQIPALAFVPLDRLPANPSPGGLSRDCHHLLKTPMTAGGRLAKTLGWGVTAEVPLDGRIAVSFIGSAEPATSGTCELGHGNIGVFEGGRIVALAYARSSAGQSIGRISPRPQGGARVWDGDVVPRPLGDLSPMVGGGLVIDKVTSSDRVCGNAAAVPTIYDLPIDRARDVLRRAGWNPVPATAGADDRDGRATDLAAAGVIEVEDCSGTGFGFCSFAYRNNAGNLSVVTVGVGPLPIVCDDQVECGRH